MRLIDADYLKTWFGEKDLYGYNYIIDTIDDAPTIEPQYEEITPEEMASEIASGSVISTSYWLSCMIQIEQMGYAICRKKG